MPGISLGDGSLHSRNYLTFRIVAWMIIFNICILCVKEMRLSYIIIYSFSFSLSLYIYVYTYMRARAHTHTHTHTHNLPIVTWLVTGRAWIIIQAFCHQVQWCFYYYLEQDSSFILESAFVSLMKGWKRPQTTIHVM